MTNYSVSTSSKLVILSIFSAKVVHCGGKLTSKRFKVSMIYSSLRKDQSILDEVLIASFYTKVTPMTDSVAD